MDVTTLFKACVKTVKTRNKSYNTLIGSVNDNEKNRILKRHVRKDEFITKSKTLVTQITRLRDFLIENRKAYLQLTSLKNNINKMTDDERDQIEIESQKIINICLNVINDLRKETLTTKHSLQYLEHRNAVINLIDNYLKSVCKTYTDLKSLRVKKAMETFKMSKLEHKFKELDPFKIHNTLPSVNKTTNESGFDKTKRTETKTTGNLDLNLDSPAISEENPLSPEEIQMFESENEQLYNDLNNLDEEVKQIENKVVHISELQQIFTEKVLEQDKDIERISTTVVGATENLRDANDQIRQAIQRNAGLRVWVLFFLLVMSFSLLFLDWYND